MSTSETITRTDLTNILNEILPVTSKVELEYTANVSAIHWSSWTAPDDGIVVIDIGWLTNGSFGYYYVKDNTDNFYVGKVTTYTANGTSNTTSFPVLKGHTYQVANQANVDGSHIYFRYYKFKNPTATCGLADFIVEQGTSGIWTYRKWNSGVCECWGATSISGLTTQVSLPFTFANTSYDTQVTLINNSNTATNVTAITNLTDKVSFGVNTVPSGGAKLYIKGRWK